MRNSKKLRLNVSFFTKIEYYFPKNQENTLYPFFLKGEEEGWGKSCIVDIYIYIINREKERERDVRRFIHNLFAFLFIFISAIFHFNRVNLNVSRTNSFVNSYFSLLFFPKSPFTKCMMMSWCPYSCTSWWIFDGKNGLMNVIFHKRVIKWRYEKEITLLLSWRGETKRRLSLEMWEGGERVLDR